MVVVLIMTLLQVALAETAVAVLLLPTAQVVQERQALQTLAAVLALVGTVKSTARTAEAAL